MMNLRQLASALAATALLTGSLTAAAEPDRPHRTTRAGGVSMVEPAGAPEGPRKPPLRLIFSNFDKPPAAFQGGGFSVLGPANTDGSGKQFVAVPFVPKYDTSVTAIALAVNHEPGSSVQKNVRVSLYADAAARPAPCSNPGRWRPWPTTRRAISATSRSPPHRAAESR